MDKSKKGEKINETIKIYWDGNNPYNYSILCASIFNNDVRSNTRKSYKTFTFNCSYNNIFNWKC